MPRFISITKAAALANVQAKEIHEKILSKQLASTRGKIHVDDFIDCYPNAQVEQVDMISLVEKIKDQSFEEGAAKQHGEVSFEALRQELLKHKTNAKYYREQLHKYEELIAHVRENLTDIQIRGTKDQRIQRLIDWMEKRLVEVQQNK